VLFDAYVRLRARGGRSLHLTLVGDGAYSGVMRARAPDDVTFAGYLEGRALSDAYSAADVFVFPSRSETLGNVVLEAFASGLPVVGVRDGGTIENVRDGVNGILCPPGDVEAFADGIRRLADDPPLRRRLGHNARAWAEARTWDAAFAPLTGAYAELARR
jgi:glycosyltransferase involved in cell wall biosynthesis